MEENTGNTPWKTDMDPENHRLVEENTLPGGQDVRGTTTSSK